MSQPLAGITVLDLTQIYQGPYCGFLMATAGADVIKIEPRGGERLRGAGGAKTQLSFATLNSNKKSITLDLKHERGKALLKELVQKADILLENYAPGVMDRLGVGWEVLHEINPALIYVSGTGYGLSGPDRDMLAMDHTIQATSGVMSSTGDPDRPPGRAGGAPSDIMGGIHMYGGAMTALLGRHATGQGTLVEVSMLEAMYFTLSTEFSAYHATGKIPQRNSARSPSSVVPYSRYECSDGGYVAIICVAQGHWHKILKVIGREDLIGHEDYEKPGKRLKNEAAVNDMLNAWAITVTRDEAFNTMREAGVPVAPIRNLEEVRNDPHMHARGSLQKLEHPQMGDVILPNNPIRYSEYDRAELEFYPEPGQHNHEIYGELLGLTPDEVAALVSEAVI